MSEKIILVGGGGHCKVVIDAIKKAGIFEVEGVLDPAQTDDILGVKICGNDNKMKELFEKGIKNAFITVGSTGDCSLRKKLYKKAKDIGFEFPVIIHPRAEIADDVGGEIGCGTFIAASATVNPGTKIGENVIVNTSASVDHDCVIGDFAHIAPGAVLSGGVEVGEEAHIGTGANITQYARIEKGELVKAGSLVFKSNTRKKTYVWPMPANEESENNVL